MTNINFILYRVSPLEISADEFAPYNMETMLYKLLEKKTVRINEDDAQTQKIGINFGVAIKKRIDQGKYGNHAVVLKELRASEILVKNLSPYFRYF